MFARKVTVPASLLHALTATVISANGAKAIELTGSIAASAHVFREACAIVKDRVIEISIYSTFVFWSANGSPDFKVKIPLTARSGTYELRLIQPDGSAVPWISVTI